MIIDINEENLDLLAITACPWAITVCPEDLRANEHCMLDDDELYNGSVIDCCRACWLTWLSKESEDNDG